MINDEWETLLAVSDALSAHAVLERLASENVEARMQSDSELLGVARQCRILVPKAQLYRAKQVLARSEFTDEELAQLATQAARSDS
jgi:flagellar biosynthesis/type III secretory pathway M-ring protein FliF/YscJ